MSMFWEDAEVTKCPLLTSTQLSEICVTKLLTGHYHTLDNRYPNPFSYFSRDLNNPRTAQESWSPGDYFQPGWESHWHSSQDPCAHAGTFLLTMVILHRLRFNRSIRVEEIITDASKISQTRHRIWPFKRFLQNTVVCTPRENSGFRTKISLLPWPVSRPFALRRIFLLHTQTDT